MNAKQEYFTKSIQWGIIKIMNKYDQDNHHRKSIRLKGYDYSSAGLYFITICCQNRKCLFGNIEDGIMILNDAGMMIEKWYWELENKFTDKKCREMVIMPNHFHCIIENLPKSGNHVGAPLRGCPIPVRGCPIGDVMDWFKTMTTNEYIRMVKQNILPRFDKRVWQRNYWEHIVRNENENLKISEYIKTNPFKWNDDKLNGGTGNIVMESKTSYNKEIWMV